MAGSFVSPSAAPAKMKVGKVNRPKRTKSGAAGFTKPDYPITDSFASESIPGFATRHANTNGKNSFCTCPAKPPAGRLARRPPSPSRGSGHEHRAKG